VWVGQPDQLTGGRRSAHPYILCVPTLPQLMHRLAGCLCAQSKTYGLDLKAAWRDVGRFWVRVSVNDDETNIRERVDITLLVDKSLVTALGHATNDRFEFNRNELDSMSYKLTPETCEARSFVSTSADTVWVPEWRQIKPAIKPGYAHGEKTRFWVDHCNALDIPSCARNLQTPWNNKKEAKKGPYARKEPEIPLTAEEVFDLCGCRRPMGLSTNPEEDPTVCSEARQVGAPGRQPAHLRHCLSPSALNPNPT
jgi:hypothetical protein